MMQRKTIASALPVVFALLLCAGCAARRPPAQNSETLAHARQGFQSLLRAQNGPKAPIPLAPADVFRTVLYPAPSGELAAYLSPDPGDGRRHPAIIWITGGDCNSIGDVWTPVPADNDQTAAAYRQAGVLMMFPSLRGGNDNPGVKEGFLGEVNDVLAALKYLKKQAYVDGNRIYLGGHSTGGTLAMLVGEYTDSFRTVFAFGPVEDVAGYGESSGFLPFDTSNPKEVDIRSPGRWLSSIRSPMWVFEGTGGNIGAFQVMAKASDNPNAHFIEIKDASHFETLAPTNALIAKKILHDTGATASISFTAEEVNRNFSGQRR